MSDEEKDLAALRPGQHVETEDMLEYVLELLAPEEVAIVEHHLASGCVECQADLASLRDEIGLYALSTVALAEPPAGSRERLLAEVTRAGSPAAPEGTQTAAPRMEVVSGGKPIPRAGTGAGVPKALAWIGWAAAAALALAATHFYQEQKTLRESLAAQTNQIAQLSADQAKARQVVDALTDRSAQRVSLALTKAPVPPQPSGRATYLANKGTLIFLASHLAPLPAGKTYELWVIPTSGKPPVAVGTFHPDAQGNANVVTADLQGTGAAKALGITVEPDGGSATPTMPIVMAGS